jgi:hypothetical protein
MGTKKTKYDNEYIKQHYYRHNLTLKKEKFDDFKALLPEGATINGAFRELIDAVIEAGGVEALIHNPTIEKIDDFKAILPEDVTVNEALRELIEAAIEAGGVDALIHSPTFY